MGFSQGACLTLEFAARHAQRYAAVAGFSGGLIGPPGTPRDYPGAFDGTPVFLGCSDVDPHIPLERVHESAGVFRAWAPASTSASIRGWRTPSSPPRSKPSMRCWRPEPPQPDGRSAERAYVVRARVQRVTRASSLPPTGDGPRFHRLVCAIDVPPELTSNRLVEAVSSAGDRGEQPPQSPRRRLAVRPSSLR